MPRSTFGMKRKIPPEELRSQWRFVGPQDDNPDQQKGYATRCFSRFFGQCFKPKVNL